MQIETGKLLTVQFMDILEMFSKQNLLHLLIGKMKYSKLDRVQILELLFQVEMKKEIIISQQDLMIRLGL